MRQCVVKYGYPAPETERIYEARSGTARQGRALQGEAQRSNVMRSLVQSSAATLGVVKHGLHVIFLVLKAGNYYAYHPYINIGWRGC